MPGPNGDLVVSLEDTCSEEEFCFFITEYMAINSMLDQINSCLDNLEETNKSLNAKLMELLESNRQIRQEFKEMASAGMHQTGP
uniref:Bublin coiled coil protein n=1 Tax=Latimeria chalumnae TaxID=7897 RepID=H3AYI0_LATCH